MKKKTFVLLVLLLSIGAFLFADGTYVKVTGVSETDFGHDIEAIKTDGSSVIYHISDETVMNTDLDDIKEGDVLLVEDNGIATMSIPPQMNATEVEKAENADQIEFSDPVSYPGTYDADKILSDFSYSYGYQMMESLKGQNLEVKGAYFQRGIYDALTLSADLLLTFDEMSDAGNEYLETVYVDGTSTGCGERLALDEIKALSKPEDLEEMFAYSYGFLLSYQMMLEGINLVAEPFISGVEASIYSLAPSMTDEEMDAAINEYANYISFLIEAYLEQLKTENLAEAESFFASNMNEKGVTVVDEYLQMKKTVENKSGKSPVETDKVKVDYILTDLEGTLLDEANGAVFSLSSVIDGFKKGIMNMKSGEEATLYVHPFYGYGESGTTTIEPNKLLVFDVKLLEINPQE